MALPISDYCDSIKEPRLILPKILSGGHPIPIANGIDVEFYSGGFCVVFPFQTAQKKYAVRCWKSGISDAKKRTQLIAKALKQSCLPYFVGFEYFEDGIMTPQGKQPIVVMDWVDAEPLKKYLAKHLNEPTVLRNLAENFKKMVKDLHESHFSHGDLQHGNIMVKNDGSLVLVDYDSMYVPALKGMKEVISGLQGYQHSARWSNKYLSEKADYFSELVIYMSIHALAIDRSLWKEFEMEDTETMLFSASDFANIRKSKIYSKLSSLGKDMQQLLKILEYYLSKKSIDDLEPFFDPLLVNKAIKTNYKPQINFKGSFAHLNKNTKPVFNKVSKIKFKPTKSFLKEDFAWLKENASSVFFAYFAVCALALVVSLIVIIVGWVADTGHAPMWTWLLWESLAFGIVSIIGVGAGE